MALIPKGGLKDNQDLILSAIEAMGHGLAIWNADGTFVVCNRMFRTQYQPRGFDLVAGTHISDLFRALVHSGELITQKSEQDLVDNELAALEQQQTTEYVFADGSVFQIERRILPEGKLATYSQDITEVKRAERKLKSFLEEAEEIGESKSRFLRAANHDLRQPLASLKILIYNCMSAADEEHRNELLHAMDISVSIMEELLGALLNIGQLDAGKVEPRITTFQISTLIERLEVQFAHQAREKGLRFSLVPSNSAVTSDRALLESIVSNFVSNAIKYTETGGIIIGCRPEGNNLRIEVWDTGCGISPDHYDAIFEEFFRISESQEHQKHSLGLGLNISKRLAAVLDHPIKIRSDFGVGSVFSVSVPIGDIWHSDIGEPEISERIGGEFTGLKALILEDDELLQNALQELLERWGIEVFCYSTAPEPQDMVGLRSAPPDFIVTDYRLKGGVEGTDAVTVICDYLGTNIPSIVVTADTAPKVIEAIKAKGFPVLIKPVSPPMLRVMIHNILFEPELLEELAGRKA